jgi:4-amino-4-deoxy-L-arabinose transferase-like glycosyltransferase
MGGALLLVPPAGEFPIDDDWVYAQAVQQLLTDGVYHRSVWIDTAFMAQAWWGAGVSTVLGFSHTSLRVGTLILAAVALLAYFALLQRMLHPLLAVGVTLLLLFHPLMFHLSYTFMTDVPFLAVMLAALWCVTVATDAPGRVRLGWLAAGSALVGLACLVRQIGVVLIPAVLLGILPELRAARTSRLRLLAALILPCCLVLCLLLSADPRDVSVEVRVTDVLWATDPSALLTVALRATAATMMLLGLTAAPAAPLILLSRRCLTWTTRQRLLVLGLLALLAVVLWAADGTLIVAGRRPTSSGTLTPLFGNTLSPAGFSISGLHPRSIAVDATTSSILVGCSVLGAVALIVALPDAPGLVRGSVAMRLLALSTVGVLAVTLGYGPLGGPVNGLYDRYLLPAVPGVLALAALAVRRHQLAVPVVAIGVLLFAGWSVTWERDYLARQAAVWNVAQTLTGDGVSPTEIDAGYEWNGWYRGDAAIEQARQEALSLGEPRRFVQLVVNGIYAPSAWYVGFGPLGTGCLGQPYAEASYGDGWPVYALRRCRPWRSAAQDQPQNQEQGQAQAP